MDREQRIKILHEIADEFQLVLLSEEIVDIATRLTEPQVSEGEIKKQNPFRGNSPQQECWEEGVETCFRLLKSHHPQPISEEKIKEVFDNHAGHLDYLGYATMSDDEFKAALKELGLTTKTD